MNRKAAFRKKKQQNKGGMLLVTVVLLMLGAVITINGFTLTAKKNELIERQESLEAQIEEQKEYSQELVELKKYTKTKKFAEEVAKEKLGLVYQDEIIFKPEE